MLEKRKPERRDRTAAPRTAADGRKRAFLGAIQKTGISLFTPGLRLFGPSYLPNPMSTVVASAQPPESFTLLPSFTGRAFPTCAALDASQTIIHLP